MQKLVTRDDDSYVASEGTRQRAREQRMRVAAPEQRGQLFQQAQQLYDLWLRACCSGF